MDDKLTKWKESDIYRIKEFSSIFRRIPPFALIFLIAFHITLLSGKHSEAVEQIFSFFYKHGSIIELVRKSCANFAVAGWFFYCLLHFLKYNLNFDGDNYHEIKPKTESFIWFVVLTKYFFDILKYYQENFSDFFIAVFKESAVQLIIGTLLFGVVFAVLRTKKADRE